MYKLSKVRLYRLLQLAQELLIWEPQTAEGGEFLEPFQGVFGITAICVFDAGTSGIYTVGTSSNELETAAREAYLSGLDADSPATGIAVRRLTSGGRPTGAIAFRGLEEPELTAAPLTSLVAAMRERARLRRKTDEGTIAAEIQAFRSTILDALGNEFKNALSTILTAAGAMREVGPLRPEQLEMAKLVEEEAARLGGVISWMDRLARLDQGEVNPRMDSTNLTAIVAQTVEQFSAVSPRQIVFVRPGLVFKTLADAELIRFALSQLLDYVCKHSPPGAEVVVEIEARGGIVIVSVSSESKPFGSHEPDRIFERAQLGSRATGVLIPSAAGLYLARKIAVAHGGTLDNDPDQAGIRRIGFRLALPGVNGQLEKS